MRSAAQIAAQRAGGGKGGFRRNQTERLPAPTLGWNARDALEGMKPGYAITLENWIPGQLGIRLREGHQLHASGLGAPVETFMEYAPPNAAGRKLFAAAGANVFNVSGAGPAPAASITGLTSALWQSTMFTTAAGAFLYIVNGFDAPRYYDGTSWVASTFTGPGLTVSRLVQVVSHKNRLWFTERGSLRAWYGPTSGIGGTLSAFDVGGLCSLGGEITAIGTWTRDGGAGPDDLLVILTSEGEALIYSGTDPANLSTWAIVGIFQIPRPISRRCFIKTGADLGVLTIDGPISLTAVLPAAGSVQKKSSLTNGISAAFRDAYGTAPTDTRWGMLDYPRAGLVLVNVPGIDIATSTQFVMSADTGGWCLFSALNAVTLGLFSERLYLGKADGTVWVYGDVYADGTAPITARMQTAYVPLSGIEQKRFMMARPVMQAPAGFVPNFTVRTDYDTTPVDLTGSAPVLGAGSIWDVSAWDVSPWEAGTVPVLVWQGVAGLGSVVSVAFAITTDVAVSVQAIDLMFDRGGVA